MIYFNGIKSNELLATHTEHD